MLFQRLSKRQVNLGSGSNEVGLSFVGGKAVISDTSTSAEAALRNSDLFSCVSLISSDVASATFRMKQGDNKHLIHLLQQQPSGLTNSFAFWQATLTTLLLNGNAYVLIYRTKDGTPYKLELIPTYDVDVNLTENGQTLFYNVRFDRDERKDITVLNNNILHFKLLSRDGIMGISPLYSLTNEIKIQNQSNKLSINALASGLMPSGILQVAKGKLNPVARNAIRNKFEEANSGENSGRTLVLDSTMTYTPKQLNSDILNILKQTDWTRKQIAKAYGIPNNYLNQESEHSNQTQIQSLYSTCLNRYTNAITSEINCKLSGVNEEVMLDTSNVVDPDNLTLIGKLADAVHWGMYTPEAAQKILQQKGAS